MNFVKKNTGFTDKYCAACGAGNPGVAAYCLICGRTAFVESYEHYLVSVKDKEVAEIKVALKAESDAEIERARKKLEKAKNDEVAKIKKAYDEKIRALQAEIAELKELLVPDSISGDDDGDEEQEFTDITDIIENYSKDDFDISGTTLLKYKSSNAVVRIPDGIQSIGENAFRGQKVERVIMPKSATAVMNCAFMDCTSLKKVDFSYGLSKIGVSAFKGCASLAEITLPSRLNVIAESAFAGCMGLRKIIFKGTREQWRMVKKRDNWIRGALLPQMVFTD